MEKKFISKGEKRRKGLFLLFLAVFLLVVFAEILCVRLSKTLFGDVMMLIVYSLVEFEVAFYAYKALKTAKGGNANSGANNEYDLLENNLTYSDYIRRH